MKVKVTKEHSDEWEITQFPTFAKGSTVKMEKAEDKEFPGWHAAVIDGHETFVPKIFVHCGKLRRDYNPTEISANVGDILTVIETVGGWLHVETANGTIGWIPTARVSEI
ncbi:MAG: SH3 domain-containing protein [Firmicutes bacterium]|nr:SH3 domain-containing protein [Bacillota bacterium]